jgi:AcrR family transcriptional regulator
MAGNEDPRALRTRRKLVDAYRRILEEGTAEPVSVIALTRRAGVTRSSFYAHFSDTSDLAVAALTDVFEVVASLDSSSRRDAAYTARDVSENSLLEVIRFVHGRRSVYTDLLAHRSEFVAATEDAFAGSAVRTLRAGGHAHGDPEVTARFIAAGAMGVISWWLRERPDLTPEQLAHHLTAIIPADFTR